MICHVHARARLEEPSPFFCTHSCTPLREPLPATTAFARCWLAVCARPPPWAYLGPAISYAYARAPTFLISLVSCASAPAPVPVSSEKYRSFTRQYFRGAAAAVVLYDITSMASFEGAKKWIEDVKQELGGGGGGGGGGSRSKAPPLVVVVGAKLDCAEEGRMVSCEQGQQLAAREQAVHLEVSSKDGTNVTATFELVARLLVERGLATSDSSRGGGRGLASNAASVHVLQQQRRAIGTAGACCHVG
jgi:hypothetical protein